MNACDFKTDRYPVLRCLVKVIALAAICVGPGLAGIDETLGGLPDLGDDGGLPAGIDSRSSFFLQGTFTEVDTVVVQMHGEDAPELVDLGGGIVRKIFHGDYEIVLDEYVLHTTNVKVGILTSTIAGPTKYMITWGGAHTPVLSVPEGSAIELPFGRIRASGMLDEPAVLMAWTARRGRSAFALQRLPGQIRVTIHH